MGKDGTTGKKRSSVRKSIEVSSGFITEEDDEDEEKSMFETKNGKIWF